jgi:hypothetical protein
MTAIPFISMSYCRMPEKLPLERPFQASFCQKICLLVLTIRVLVHAHSTPTFAAFLPFLAEEGVKQGEKGTETCHFFEQLDPNHASGRNFFWFLNQQKEDILCQAREYRKFHSVYLVLTIF